MADISYPNSQGNASGAIPVYLAIDGVAADGNHPIPVALEGGNLTVGNVGISQTPFGQSNGVSIVGIGNAALPGNASIPVSFAGSGVSAVVSLTRPNDTNVYAANDVIGTATGSTAALTFALAAGQFMITSAVLEIDIAAVVSGMTSFVLQLYSVTPPSAYGDNAAWDLGSGDRASYLGPVNLGTPVDVGSTLYVYTAQLNQQILIAGTANLFAYLTTIGTWTPAANTAFKITLYGLII